MLSNDEWAGRKFNSQRKHVAFYASKQLTDLFERDGFAPIMSSVEIASGFGGEGKK